MSKDIRSFFIAKNPAKGQKTILDKSTKKTGDKPGHKKRPIIIDSDSDEELSPVNAKRSKSSVEDKKKNSNKKPEVKETKSKYFECPNVSVDDIFGNSPVKRDTSRKIIKRVITKNEDKESHFDKDFEEELLTLDDTWSELIPKGEGDEIKDGKHMNGVEESPKKTDLGLQKDKHTMKSPCKKKSNYDESESPKKKFKSEDKGSSDTKADKNKDVNNKPITLNYYKKESPIKNSVSTISSPKESPTNHSPLKKSPLNKGVSKTPEKSPYKKLSLSRGKKESFKNEDSTMLNGEISHAKLSNASTSEVASEKLKTIEKDSSLNKKIVEKELPSKLNERYKKKEDSAAEKLSDRTEMKKDSTAEKISDRKEKNKDSTPSGSVEKLATAPLPPSNLWVERYKPTATKQIIGQQGEKSCVNKLISWLNKWEKNHSGNKKLVKPSPWAKNDDGAFFKAALLSGPPGVGKTTTAHLVCKELGLDVVEFNASDTRSKRLLHEEVSELLSTKSLSPFFTGKGDQVTKKHVLLMDEVDGMAGNEDRGGVQELISLIKQSRVPVICMCNDRNHPKIRSLANYCFDLRFSKPRVEQIRGAMMSVCFKEKLKLKPDELSDIITSANQDIRLVMNHLSMLSMQNSGMANSTKHIKLGPWDIVRKIFSEQEHKSMSIYDKCDLFFHDYSITPLFVQENYVNAVPHKPEANNKIKKMELFAKAAKSLSLGDLTEKSIRSHNAWGLLPVQAIFSSLVPGEVLEGHLGAQINFPAWFGKNSRQTKMSRLVQELTVHSRLKISGNREAMNLDYLTALESTITSPLLRDGADGVTAALAVLSEYTLVREDMESISELSTWPGCKNRFAQVDSKVKAAFTRAYNKTSAPTPYAAVPVKKGRGDVDLSEGLGEEDETGTQDVEEEEDEGLETDAMIMVKKKPAGKKADKDVQPSTSKGSKTSKRGKKK